MEFMLVTSVNSFKCILKNKFVSGGISMNRVLDAVVLGGSFLININLIYSGNSQLTKYYQTNLHTFLICHKHDELQK